MSRPIPIQARYIHVEQHLIITLKNNREVRGRVAMIVKEKGRPDREGRIHVSLESHPQPYTLHPNQTVSVL